MKKMYNERHVQMENVATDLDVLKVLKSRGAWDNDLDSAYKYLDAKEAGMNKLLETITKYAKNHWMYMTNVSLSQDNTLNCDFLLLTSTTLYTFEVIHYEGFYEVEDGNGFLNGERLDHEPIGMAQKVTSKVKNLAAMGSMPINLNVEGIAVFTNPDTDVIIPHEIDTIDIITNDQLEQFIEDIVQEEREKVGDRTQPTIPMHLSWLRMIDRHHPVWGIKVPDEIHERVQPGIICSYCESFNIEIGEIFMTCECGGWEATEVAIVRTICEYGVINQDKHLYPPDLHLFFDFQVSIEKIDKHLAKHFSPAW